MKSDLKKYLLIIAFILAEILVIIWIQTPETEELFSKILVTQLLLLLFYIGYKEFKKLPK